MIHGQAIGIPFRRRKGEQAPPPPKEVAWNPTIESNLPYKEVKYFKFVEGGGWQALNIGEILPVGQRVMIRIVTTEPYYEVSKAVSSQMTDIQIGKNGESEYDIAGTLTVYSPQILTVTIGVDKNYVQWNPVVESNAEYQVVDFYIDTYPAVVGNYYLISSKLRIAITTKGATDEVTSLTVNGVSFGAPSINGNRFTFNGTLPDKSPQNVNIAIDEYIRFEDIVQAYPLFFEFTDENGNLISWGGKAKVGSTITRTKGVAYANLLESLYTVTNPRLNGIPLASAEHVVEKSMVFTCTATWKLSNEPNCILSNQILPIPNSSYKYLGYQPDLSGHGNHGVFNNFEYAGMSGANGYTEQEFSKWRYNIAEKRAEFTISNDVKLNIAKVVLARAAILYTLIGDYTTDSIQRYRVTGVDENHPIVFGNDSPVDALLTVTKDGEYEVDWKTYGKNPCIFATWTGDCNITIEQIGEYEGAICFNGVNNCMTIPALEHGGKQVLMKVNWQSNVGDAILYDQRGGDAGFAIYNGAVVVGGLAIAYRGRNIGGSTYIDGVLNNHIECSQLRNITHNIIELYDPELGVGTLSPRIGFSNTNINYAQMALFAFMSFPEISPEEEIKELNDIVGIEPKVELPPYYWDAYGKSNTPKPVDIDFTDSSKWQQSSVITSSNTALIEIDSVGEGQGMLKSKASIDSFTVHLKIYYASLYINYTNDGGEELSEFITSTELLEQDFTFPKTSSISFYAQGAPNTGYVEIIAKSDAQLENQLQLQGIIDSDVDYSLKNKNFAYEGMSGYNGYPVVFGIGKTYGGMPSIDGFAYTVTPTTVNITKFNTTHGLIYSYLKRNGELETQNADYPSYKIKITGIEEDFALHYYYLNSPSDTGVNEFIMNTDGIYTIPKSYASDGSLVNDSVWIGFIFIGTAPESCNVTIEVLPEYENGLAYDGVNDYSNNTNIPAFTDFTAIAKRVWVNKDNPANECFIHKGVINTPISESAFMLEYEITNDTYYRSSSFGGYINVERVNRPESITYQTTESYNGIPIIKGSGIDTKGLVVGAVTNNYWKGVFYKLILYPKTIPLLQINFLKNLMERDEIIDLNNPIFKK